MVVLVAGTRLWAAGTLAHRYQFDANAQDTVGTAHGQLVGGATLNGTGVVLDGSSGYVNLPNNLITGYTSVTFETWVSNNLSGTWARIWDFGNSSGGEDFPLGSGTSGSEYLFITTRNGGGSIEVNYTVPGLGQSVDWSGTQLPSGVRKHIVWTSDAAAQTMLLYVDGMLVGSNTATTLTPAALGPTVNNWLGRSQWNDPLFNGSIDEFRIYDGALSPLQVAISVAAGSDRVVVDPGALQAVSLQVGSSLVLGAVQTPVVRGNFLNITNVLLTSVPGLVLSSSDTNVIAIDASGRLVASHSGLATITANFQGVTDAKAVLVLEPPQTLLHRYEFSANANDSEGTAHGSLLGGATITNGTVSLNGSSAYVDLPNKLITGLTSMSIEAWFTDTGGNGWARLWDLGNSVGGEGQQGGGTSYSFLSLPAGFGGVRSAYKLAGQGEQVVDYALRPSIGARHHVAWVQDAATSSGRLYLDGTLVAENNSFTYTPAAIGDTVNDWLGRSQYNDPWFKGSIDEFRIYSAPLTAAEVQQGFQLGPDVSPQSVPVSVIAQPQNLTVNEQQPASFSVGYIGHRPVKFQWRRNGVAIPGATNSTYSLAFFLPADNGAVFSVLLTNTVTNVTFSAVSSNAVLTVVPDTQAPTLVRAYNIGSNQVQVIFSEAVEVASATNKANYVFTNGLAISTALLGSDKLSVTLTTGTLVGGSNYTVRVSNVRDRATAPNTIAANSPVSFTATPYALQDIGSPVPAGVLTFSANSYTLAAGGSGVGGTADQCSFSYQWLTGDFDLQVRVQALDAVAPWTQAGLMARETLDPGSRFAGAFTSPQLQGSYFESRASSYAKAVSSGNFPPNLPNAWLRLRRVGNVFTGYASYDGVTWVQLGSTTLGLPSSIPVGLALSSHSNGSAATARFTDVSTTISTTVGTVTNPSEPLGPSSRRTPIVISEIMYKPAPPSDSRNLEFIELFNSNPWFHDVSGYRLDGDVKFRFPPNTTIPAGGFLVIAAAPADLQAIYGLAGVFGPYTNSLKTSGKIELKDETGALLLETEYSDELPWPVGADGSGHSIVLARPTYGEADARAWDRSDAVGGSPGGFEPFRPSALRNVMLNEVLAHTDPPQIDSVELYNHGNTAVNLSGCTLSDSATTNKFVIPTNTTIAARGFVYFTEAQLGFSLDAAGETLYFRNPDGSRVLDALKFDAQENGVSYGRYPNGAPDWCRLATNTFGSSNAAPRVSSIAINEIMYHPISGLDDDQYVELFNRGASAVNLGGWKLVAGISYSFPSNTILAANGYLVVAANSSRLLTNYPQLNATNLLGNFTGRLSGKGERLALAMPDDIVSTNISGYLVTNHIDIVVDEVTYGSGGRWGQWADGGGSSLELLDARADKRRAASWADSDETGKALWTNIELTGVLDHGANYDANIGFAQIGLLDAGECLVDSIEVRGPGGANFVANPNFDGGLANWSLQGDHSRSSLESNSGYPSSGPALHLRTANRMWTGANSAQLALSDTSMASGQTATLRFKARWLAGWPEVLLRLNGNWLEAAGRMTVPANLGTPGLPNSRATTNAAPAISDVTHTPALPAAGQAVVVTARVTDPDGVNSLLARYRVDPATTYTDVTMRDDGSLGDAIANDGVFSATIPGQSAGVTVAFIVTATDAKGASSRFPALLNDNAPVRECVVIFGDPNPPSSFGAYHLWLTQTNVNRWNSLPILSNEEMDGTLVVGSRVIYNAGARYAGSPYHQSYDAPFGSRACHYIWSVPKDDMLLGSASFNKIHWPGNDIQSDSETLNNNDATLQREQAANTFLRALGVPWVNRRFVAVYVNGHRRGGFMEDALRPSSSATDMYFPGDVGGRVYKFQPWFEFGSAPSGTYMPWANMSWGLFMPYTTTGGAYKTARYRWTYECRATPDSVNNYTNLFTLITAGSAGGATNYVAALENQADMENWMRLVAANHAAGNWDCWGVNNEQNIYGYVSPQQRWTLFMFDFGIVLGNPISWSPGANLWSVNGDDPNWQRIYNTPTFRRMYLRALKELTETAMTAEAANPLLEAKYAAFVADGVNAQSPAAIETWIAQARSSIALQVAAEDTPLFSLTAASFTASANTVTLTGNAPLDTVEIFVNGQSYKPTWTSSTGWTLRLPAPYGTNTWSVAALARTDAVVGSTNQITVINTSVPASPVGNVVINELMVNPASVDGEFVELYNRSATTPFDLSGWRLNGLSHTFPSGSVLGAQQYLVLARSRITYAATYGALAPVSGDFSGDLQKDGETISLLAPGAVPGSDVVVDRLRYEAVAPWLTTNLSAGTSLQVRDANQDNSRVGDWAGIQSNAVAAPQWVYFYTNGTVTSARLYMYLESAGEVFIDDVKLVSGSVPEVGTNLLVNGDFESALASPWIVTANFTQSVVTASAKRNGNSGLRMIATAAGSGGNNSIYQDIVSMPTNGAPVALSFWYRQATNGGLLNIRLSSSGVIGRPTIVAGAPPAGVPATPAAANSVALTLPEFPSVWLNELQTVNASGIADNFGQREPWIELFNAGSNTVSLGGLYLSTNYLAPTDWAFPASATIAPGQFLTVWCDGQPQQTAGAVLHTSFRLGTNAGSIFLSRMVSNAVNFVDYLNFSALAANESYGDVPDAQPFYRQTMFLATPGGTNNAALPPTTVAINEWMAENTGFITDPATAKYEDWFELYNPTATPAELGGYFLTDTLTNQFQYQIPAGYRVPAHGFLLVWADEKTSANSTNTPDLHVPFKLSKSGEAIGLIAPDGTPVDTVTFGVQTANVSEGRYFDGTALRLFLTTPTPGAPNQVPPAPQPPTISQFSVTPGGPVALSLQVYPGHTYRVEYRDDLSSGEWLSLQGNVFASGSQLNFQDSNPSPTHRFYRVVQVN